MMFRVRVTALLVVLAVLPAACSSLIPTGACDDYHQGLSPHPSSCTADGKLASTRATGCSDPDGLTYTTTTTACSAHEHCVANEGLGTAACLRSCVTDGECQQTDTPWCRSGSCVAPLQSGDDCTTSARCADGLSCSATVQGTVTDASTRDASDGGDPVCALGSYHPYGTCTCR